MIIEKHYRGLINRSICDYFWDQVNKAPSPSQVPPVIITPKFYLVHVQRNGLYFLATVQNEVPPLLVLDFLQRLYDVFHEYFSNVNEGTLKENFSTVYQVFNIQCIIVVLISIALCSSTFFLCITIVSLFIVHDMY